MTPLRKSPLTSPRFTGGNPVGKALLRSEIVLCPPPCRLHTALVAVARLFLHGGLARCLAPLLPPPHGGPLLGGSGSDQAWDGLDVHGAGGSGSGGTRGRDSGSSAGRWRQQCSTGVCPCGRVCLDGAMPCHAVPRHAMPRHALACHAVPRRAAGLRLAAAMRALKAHMEVTPLPRSLAHTPLPIPIPFSL